MERVTFRLTAEEKARVMAAARARGLSVGAYLMLAERQMANGWPTAEVAAQIQGLGEVVRLLAAKSAPPAPQPPQLNVVRLEERRKTQRPVAVERRRDRL